MSILGVVWIGFWAKILKIFHLNTSLAKRLWCYYTNHQLFHWIFGVKSVLGDVPCIIYRQPCIIFSPCETYYYYDALYWSFDHRCYQGIILVHLSLETILLGSSPKVKALPLFICSSLFPTVCNFNTWGNILSDRLDLDLAGVKPRWDTLLLHFGVWYYKVSIMMLTAYLSYMLAVLSKAWMQRTLIWLSRRWGDDVPCMISGRPDKRN
jgi:hypothetical protein